MSWDTELPDPIPVPRGSPLATLRDAGDYITKLPKSQHDAKPWQTAMQCLLQAAVDGGPLLHARVGIMQALYPKGEPAYRPHGAEPKWRNNYKLVRDR